MFQYAAARALALRNSAEIVVDNWSGFVRDKEYRRQYELGSFNIAAPTASSLERLPLWLYRLHSKVTHHSNQVFQRQAYGKFIVEHHQNYLPQVANHHIEKSWYMMGYWQSPKYFDDQKSKILSELYPPAPSGEQFLKLRNEMRNTESVALGIRLYEESSEPAVHARNGRLKTADNVNEAIFKIRTEKPNARVYVFCTHMSAELNKLRLPERTRFVLPSEGFTGSIENLWLLTQCKHHIFTNSSFYWWGAWLSQKQHDINDQIIFAADNFLNPDAFCENWQQF